MIKEIKMPEISEDADGGTVVEILVQEGDTIEEEQSIIAVESDKASVEVPATAGGTVKEIKIAEGDEVKVGAVIMTLETNGKGGGNEEKTDEEAAEGEEEQDKKRQKATEEEEAETKEDEGESDTDDEETAGSDEEKSDEEVAGKAKQKEEDKPKAKGESEKGTTDEQNTESTSDVPAAPSIRRMARELGINIRSVQGSGPGERITADDVKAYAGNGQQKDAAKEGQATAPKNVEKALPDFSKWGTVRREKMSGIRKATVSSMSDAWQTIPHVTQFDKADITQLEEYTEKYKAKVEKAGGKLTITAIMMKVAVAALRAFPKFNASLDVANEEVVLKDYYHIGVAADTEKGLLVPVIRDVDKKSVIKLSKELPDIAQKAREGKLSGDEMKGGTFTISNLGGIGGTQFTPIVYKPQVAIMGISRTQTEPVYIDGAFQPRSILPLSLSYDHRLIDGAEAARFLRFICQSLEDPFVMLMEG